jgi:hypothetical protein
MDLMPVEAFMVDTVLRAAVTAVRQGGDDLHEALARLIQRISLNHAKSA